MERIRYMELASGIIKDEPGRLQALPVSCCALPLGHKLKSTSKFA